MTLDNYIYTAVQLTAPQTAALTSELGQRTSDVHVEVTLRGRAESETPSPPLGVLGLTRDRLLKNGTAFRLSTTRRTYRTRACARLAPTASYHPLTRAAGRCGTPARRAHSWNPCGSSHSTNSVSPPRHSVTFCGRGLRPRPIMNSGPDGPPPHRRRRARRPAYLLRVRAGARVKARVRASHSQSSRRTWRVTYSHGVPSRVCGSCSKEVWKANAPMSTQKSLGP